MERIENLEWLQRQMYAKTCRFDVGIGGVAQIDWQDKCGAIAAIGNPCAKALACIIVWPDREWSEDYQILQNTLVNTMLKACDTDGKQPPRLDGELSLEELATRMARMVIYMQLHGLWDDYTVKGRLKFAGVPLSVDAYSKTWKHYERQMLDLLERWKSLADTDVGTYRKNMSVAA